MTNYLFWKRFAQGKLKTHVSSLKVRIPSPKEILSWSERRLPNSTLVGKVDNAHTVEHDTLRPVSGGLFCERIFGPIATNVCACLRKKGWNEDYCKICEVQFTKSRLRRYQMGHILLAAPVIHVWALQGGYLASLLGKKNFGIRSVAYGKVMSQSKLFESYTYGLTHTEDRVSKIKVLRLPKVSSKLLNSQEVIRKDFHGLETDLEKTIDIQSFDLTNFRATQEKKAQKGFLKNNTYLGVSRTSGEMLFDTTSIATSNLLARTSSGTFDFSWKQLVPFSFAFRQRRSPRAPYLMESETKKQKYKVHRGISNLKTMLLPVITEDKDLKAKVLRSPKVSSKLLSGQEIIKKGSFWQYPRTEGFSYFPKSILFPLFLWTRDHSFSTKSTQNLPESKISASKTHHFTLWKAKVIRKGSKLSPSKNHEVIRTFSRALSEPKMQLILPLISTVSFVHLIYPSTPLPFLPWLSSKTSPLPYRLAYTQDKKHLNLLRCAQKYYAFLSFAENNPKAILGTFVTPSPKAKRYARKAKLRLLLCTFGARGIDKGDAPYMKGKVQGHRVSPKNELPLKGYGGILPQLSFAYTPKGYGIGESKETETFSYTQGKPLSPKGIGQDSGFLSYGCTNEGVIAFGSPLAKESTKAKLRSHVQKILDQNKKTKYFKLSSTTKKVISVLSFLYTYKKYPLLERQEKNLKKKKKRVYERGNVLPFHQFILYKPDCFKKISQFFDSLNKEQTPAPKLPLPFYSRLKNFAKSKSPDAQRFKKSDDDKSRMRLVVKNLKSSRTCLLLPQYPYTPLSAQAFLPDSLAIPRAPYLRYKVHRGTPSAKVSKAMPKKHKGIGYGKLGTKLSPIEGRDLEVKMLCSPKISSKLPSNHKELTKGLHSKNLFRIKYTNGKQNNIKNALLSKTNLQCLNPYSLTFISPRGIKDSREEIENSQKSYTIDSTYSSSSGQVLNTTSDFKAKRNFGVFNKFDVLDWRHTKTGDTLPALLYPFTPFYPYNLTSLYPFGVRGIGKGEGVKKYPLGTHRQKEYGDSEAKKGNNLLPTSSSPFQKISIFSFTYSLPPVSKSQVNTNVQKKLKNIEFTGPSVLSQTLKNLNLVLLDRLVNWKWKIGKTQLDSFLLQNKLTKKKRGLRNKLAKTKIILTRRRKLIQSFLNTKQLPEWMILSVLPVLPPALRPILELEPNNVVVSDLNTLYQTVIRRNDALTGLLTFRALEIDILNRQVSLQQAIEKLFDKGAGTKKRPVKSLSQGFHGKRGLFRLHLLGKRVDYSGRSVIVVGPRLKLHECGLPKEMALVLFLPFLIARLKRRKVANNTSQAKQLIIRKDKQIWSHLKALIYEHPVLLNRAPTLHRLGFQAFQPILVSGKAIILPALVCTGFNADFDGDQMAVHIPLSYAARAESWKLLYAKNNMLSPATGKPIIVLSQEMILGCYCSSLILNKTHFALRTPIPLYPVAKGEGVIAEGERGDRRRRKEYGKSGKNGKSGKTLGSGESNKLYFNKNIDSTPMHLSYSFTPLPLYPYAPYTLASLQGKVRRQGLPIPRTPFAFGDHPVSLSPSEIEDKITPMHLRCTGYRGKGVKGYGAFKANKSSSKFCEISQGVSTLSLNRGFTSKLSRRLCLYPEGVRHRRTSVKYFTTFQEVHMALNHNKIALQTAIWLRIPSFEDNQFLEEPLEVRLDAVGHSFRSYGQSQRHFSKNTKSQNQIKGISYIRTSAGRIQLNEVFYSSLRTSESSLSWAV